jgi:hypothetical protein
MLARIGRLVLVGAVLLAQQTALAHQYWHAAKATVSADAKKSPKGHGLCDLHDLLGTVLGVAGGTAQAPALLEPLQPAFAASATSPRQAAPLARHSRDPPLIS